MTQENQEKQEKKKEKKTVIVGKMNLASSVMSSVKNGAISVFSAGFVNPHKKNITSDVKHFHIGEISQVHIVGVMFVITKKIRNNFDPLSLR